MPGSKKPEKKSVFLPEMERVFRKEDKWNQKIPK